MRTFLWIVIATLLAILGLALAGVRPSSAQQQPVPVLKKTKASGPDWSSGHMIGRPAQGWQRFKGATSCTQTGNRLVCDNGYQQSVR